MDINLYLSQESLELFYEIQEEIQQLKEKDGATKEEHFIESDPSLLLQLFGIELQEVTDENQKS